MGGGDLAEALATIPLPEHRDPIHVDWPAADVAAFEPGPAHAGPDSFDDEVALQLGDRADDDHNGATERAAGIEVLAEADVLDVETIHRAEIVELGFGVLVESRYAQVKSGSLHSCTAIFCRSRNGPAGSEEGQRDRRRRRGERQMFIRVSDHIRIDRRYICKSILSD